MSKPDEICGRLNESIDDLLTSVDAMRRTSPPADVDGTPNPEGERPADDGPIDLKTRFDALYETIDAFAGAVDDRMSIFASKVEGAFAEPAGEKRRRSGGKLA